jgi:hypothetical protein
LEGLSVGNIAIFGISDRWIFGGILVPDTNIQWEIVFLDVWDAYFREKLAIKAWGSDRLVSGTNIQKGWRRRGARAEEPMSQ